MPRSPQSSFTWLTEACITLLAVAPLAYGAVGESSVFELDTRDSNSTHVAESGVFAFDTRLVDGLAGDGVSNRFVLDTRTYTGSGLLVMGPVAVGTGTQTAYQAVIVSGGTGTDVTANTAFSLMGAPLPGIGIGGSHLFVSTQAAPQTVYLVATYRNLSGQVMSAPVAVQVTTSIHVSLAAQALSTGGTNYTVMLTGSASGGLPPYAFRWDTNNDGVYGDQVGDSASYPLTSTGGTYPIGLEVIDGTGARKAKTGSVIVNKPLVANQPVNTKPTADPVVPGFYGTDGVTPFAFDDDKRSKGLLVITHGMFGSSQDQWLGMMAGAIQGQLGSNCPNILIFDWHEDADVTLDEESVVQLKSLVASIKVKGALSGFAASIAEAEILSTDFVLEFLSLRLSSGPKAGRRLADWIVANSQSDGGQLPKIDINAPIQLIGHSAGGFCISECASVVKDRGVLIDMVTMLDTPIPSGWNLIRQHDPGYAEHYASSWWGVLETPETWALIEPAFGHYHKSIIFLNAVAAFSFFELGHGWSYTWYTNTVFDGTQDGFYYSPFVPTGNKINKGSSSMLAKAKTSSVFAQEGGAVLPDQLLTGFTEFGNVAANAASYTLVEELDAGITQTMTIPVGAEEMKFRYQFTSAGDGDFLEVHLSGYPALYVGEDLPLSRLDFVEASIPMLPFDGQIHTLTFTLVSRGAANAVLQVEDIRFSMTDDPDGDGLATDQEIATGSLPLTFDSDGDGLGDGDEVNVYFTNPMLADSDGDGVSDDVELTAGTSPTNGQSYLRVTDMTKNPGGTFTLRWSSESGRLYNVQRSADVTFATFEVIGQGVSATPPLNTFVDNNAGAAQRMFYRVEAYVP